MKMKMRLAKAFYRTEFISKLFYKGLPLSRSPGFWSNMSTGNLHEDEICGGVSNCCSKGSSYSYAFFSPHNITSETITFQLDAVCISVIFGQKTMFAPIR